MYGSLYLQTLTTLTHRQASTEQIQIQFSDQKLTNTAPPRPNWPPLQCHTLVRQRLCFLTIVEMLEKKLEGAIQYILSLCLEIYLKQIWSVASSWQKKELWKWTLPGFSKENICQTDWSGERRIPTNIHIKGQRGGALKSQLCRRILFIRLTRQFWKRIVGQILWIILLIKDVFWLALKSKLGFKYTGLLHDT